MAVQNTCVKKCLLQTNSKRNIKWFFFFFFVLYVQLFGSFVTLCFCLCMILNSGCCISVRNSTEYHVWYDKICYFINILETFPIQLHMLLSEEVLQLNCTTQAPLVYGTAAILPKESTQTWCTNQSNKWETNPKPTQKYTEDE